MLPHSVTAHCYRTVTAHCYRLLPHLEALQALPHRVIYVIYS